ncbi:bis(5'-nucleosyl)-tetraphosphatase [asymmetrical] [Polistes fuscatus]|uniref:bis(5'-nucleosyl)-tetraphosphatase [asymmetrical] n=1 Tax=Polistes fuscatus TaxID=30207 RepID=UPI001CA984DB|nr:bis(5'-nucleosyl)-tetraphosphatase [asymmetrical] [Polistes fuscatus]
MSMYKRACGFVIFRQIQDSIEYLLMQTSYGNHHWTPPKGHVDEGETDFETALRETEEEAGFVENDLKIFQDAKVELKYIVNGVPKIVIYWLAELINPNQPVRMSSEHQAYKWLKFQEACNLAEYMEMQNALKQFNEYIDKNVKKK